MQHKKSWLKFFLILFVVVSSGCETQESVIIEPNKPVNVPSKAIWVGGVDGGVFVLVKESEQSSEGIYLGEIYYVSGDLSYKGFMKIFPDSSLPMDLDSKDSYQGWDGDTLYLSGGKYLKIQE